MKNRKIKIIAILVACIMLFVACSRGADNGVTPVSKIALQVLYTSVSNLDYSDFTAESWSDFENSLTVARTVLANAEATQQEVDAAYAALTYAYENLVLIEDNQPTKIMTRQQLEEITFDGHYILGADLDLTDFVPLGCNENPFRGFFDGNGHTITSLTIDIGALDIDSSGNVFVGIFAVNRGVIGDLIIENILIFGTNATSGIRVTVFVGAIAGRNRGYIHYVEVDGEINFEATGADTRLRAGLIAGRNDGVISYVVANGNIEAELIDGNSRLGGIAGLSDGGALIRCIANVDILTSSRDGNIVAGGLVGLLEEDDVIIDKSVASGDVTSIGITAIVYAGGLVGNIDATDVVGRPDFMVRDSYSTGDTHAITGGNAYAAGLVARIENAGYAAVIIVLNTFSIGTVTMDSTGSNRFASGLVGRIQWLNTSYIVIENSFTTSNIMVVHGASASTIRGTNAANTSVVGEIINTFFAYDISGPSN